MGEQTRFKAEIKKINGKNVLFIKPEIEEIIKEGNRKDVVIHVPSLSTSNTQLKLGGE